MSPTLQTRRQRPRPSDVGPVLSVAHLVRMGQWRSAGVALACAGLFMSAASLYSLHQSMRHALVMAAHSLAFAAEPAIRFRDLEALRELAEQLAEREQLAWVNVVDAQGQRLLKVERPGQTPFDGLARQVADLFMPQVVTAAVQGGRAGSGGLGEVQLRSDGRALLDELSLLLLALLGCVAVTALVVLVVSRRLTAVIVQPLRAMVELTRAVRISRSFERRAQATPVQELNALADDFNALLVALQRQQRRVAARHNDLRRSNESLRHASLHDALTGLPNRSHLFAHLAEVFERCQRQGVQAAVLFIDVDRFKQVNDTLGHAVGDALLVELAHRLQSAVRESDFVARHGGDEFLAVLFPVGDEAEVRLCVDRLRRALVQPLRLDNGQTLPMSVSIGTALFPAQGRSVDELVRSADAAMYRDKVRSSALQPRGTSPVKPLPPRGPGLMPDPIGDLDDN
ncbi:MAG: sensor domain-containing diguanylate cyclase [Curvibacter sp.]|nr:MAG: sensor domain-containing diguanylate cyclase [Curvibacter sp.]